ncbi:hypothetical protein CK203_103276 [Vitis vinifera]|uniref:Reverse transcriptase Ty1/copia-type domain-containing protein n=1 Tax=Vitis vinifera TaxID=29760 RepID=A0A438FI46_VITVI|nr:hypothetical protein CK203_103276 [Vitis vinifera]
MLRCKIVNAPIKSNHKLGNKNKEPMADWGIHKRIVGKLIYLSNTKLDIAYAISVTTLGKGITFQKNDDFKLGAYTNANWSSSMVDKRSTTRQAKTLDLAKSALLQYFARSAKTLATQKLKNLGRQLLKE